MVFMSLNSQASKRGAFVKNLQSNTKSRQPHKQLQVMVLQFYIVFTVLFMQTLKFKPAYNNIAFLLPIKGGGK